MFVADSSSGPVLLLPGVDRRFTHPELPADVADRGVRLDLAQRVGDLLLGELRALHRSPPACGGPPKPRLYSSCGLSSFPGKTSPTPMLLFLVNYNDPTRQA